MKFRVAAIIALVVACTGSIAADVRTDEKSKVEFAGALGKIVNIFGGKAAREGVTSTVAVKGDRRARLNDTTGQIVDLTEEKIYDLDMKRKTYKVTTFAELRRQMEEAQRKAEERAKTAEPSPQKESAPKSNEKQAEIDFDLKDTGEKKVINGFDTHEVVMTITVREKGKTLDEAGGMVLTSDLWMGPKVEAMREIADFEIKYMRALQGPAIAGASPDEMASAVAMYPMMRDAIGRMNTENVKMDGTPIQTTTKIDAVKSAAQMAEEQKSGAETESKDSAPKSVGGLLGGFAKKAAARKKDDQPAASNRATVMTTTTEILKVATTVGPEVTIPAGFQQK